MNDQVRSLGAVGRIVDELEDRAELNLRPDAF